MREELQKVRDWAANKIATGQEPPWAWYQYMKLCEAVDTILLGMESVTSSPQSGSRSGAPLRLVDEAYRPDGAPPQPPDQPISLPM